MHVTAKVRATLVAAALLRLGGLSGRAAVSDGSGGSSDSALVRWTARDIGGRPHPSAEAGAPATVWVFIAHDCPISNTYAPELIRLRADYAARGIPLNLVYAETALPVDQLKAHANAHGFASAGPAASPTASSGAGSLFSDPDYRLAHACGITTTPEVAIITPDGAVAYRGRIDNRYPRPGQDRIQATQFDLRDALNAILAHRPVSTPRTPAVGCTLELR